MKKILIIKNRYGTSYFDASTQELEDAGVLQFFSYDKSMVDNLLKYEGRETFFLSQGNTTKEQYEEYKKTIESINQESPVYKFGQKLVSEYEQSAKDEKKYLASIDLIRRVLNGERPINKKGNQIALRYIFEDVFSGSHEFFIEHISEIKQK